MKIKVWAIYHYHHYEGGGPLSKYFINKDEAFDYLTNLVKKVNLELIEEENRVNNSGDSFYKEYPFERGQFELRESKDAYTNEIIYETYSLDEAEIEIVGLENK